MRRISPVILLAVLLVFCSAPKGQEQFVRGKGPWTFTVRLDSLTVSDFYFYTRRDGAPSRRSKVAELPLDIEWISPAADTLVETVYLPLESKSSFYSSESSILYRSEVTPPRSGDWTLVVSPHDSVTVRGLRGLGIAIKNHGAR